MAALSLTGAGLANAGQLSNTAPSVWWDLSDPSTVFSDDAATSPVLSGGAIAVILDKSGNGFHATQTDSAARPLWNSAGYLTTDGVDDRVGHASVTWSDTQTLVAVVQSLSMTSTLGRFVARGANNGFIDATGLLFWRVNEAGNNVTSVTMCRLAPIVISSVRSSDSAQVARVNGTQIMSFDPSANENAALAIGAQLPSAATNALACQCWQVALWNRVLSASELDNVERMLGAKAGVTW